MADAVDFDVIYNQSDYTVISQRVPKGKPLE